jgi:hypothetical protein
VLTAGLDVTHSLRNAAAVLAGHTSVAVEQTGSAIYGEKYGKEVINIPENSISFVFLGPESCPCINICVHAPYKILAY